MTKKPRKLGKSDKTKQKDKAWSAMSKYIRLKNSDEYGNCICVTCGKTKHWKEIHAGHFVDGRNNTVLFDERLVFPQCFHCNSKRPGCLAGNKVKYFLYMKSLGYTDDELEAFDNMKHQTKKLSIAELKEIQDYYEDKLCGLEIASGEYA